MCSKLTRNSIFSNFGWLFAALIVLPASALAEPALVDIEVAQYCQQQAQTQGQACQAAYDAACPGIQQFNPICIINASLDYSACAAQVAQDYDDCILFNGTPPWQDGWYPGRTLEDLQAETINAE